jgi:hypothetical protein
MAVADDWRADDEQADDRNAGEHRLSLAEWLVLCLAREEPTYGLVLAGLLARDGRLGQIWPVPRITPAGRAAAGLAGHARGTRQGRHVRADAQARAARSPGGHRTYIEYQGTNAPGAEDMSSC